MRDYSKVRIDCSLVIVSMDTKCLSTLIDTKICGANDTFRDIVQESSDINMRQPTPSIGSSADIGNRIRESPCRLLLLVFMDCSQGA